MSNKTSASQEWEYVLETLATIEVKPNWHAVAASTNIAHPQNAYVPILKHVASTNLLSTSRRKFRDICKTHGYLYDGRNGTLKKVVAAPAAAAGATNGQEAAAETAEVVMGEESPDKKRKVDEGMDKAASRAE